jgi:hypothetical protein
MSPSEFSINVSGLSDRENEMAASDLTRALKTADPSTNVARQPNDSRTMDAGATLLLILGSGAAVAIAHGLQSWIGRWRNASLVFSDGTRKLEVHNVTSSDINRIIEFVGGTPRS